jgi:dienelactone hydrolase
MTPILRGENGQPGTFSLFYDEVDDVLAAAGALASQPGVDAQHLDVSGHSVGGTLTLLAAMTSKRFRAAASLSGSPDQSLAFPHDDPRIPFDPDLQVEYRMRSPLEFATSLKCPTRLYFGSREGSFRRTTPELARRAQAADLDVEAISVQGDHFSMVPPAVALAIAFFATQR